MNRVAPTLTRRPPPSTGLTSHLLSHRRGVAQEAKRAKR